jgi:hypothetical protein
MFKLRFSIKLKINLRNIREFSIQNYIDFCVMCLDQQWIVSITITCILNTTYSFCISYVCEGKTSPNFFGDAF